MDITVILTQAEKSELEEAQRRMEQDLQLKENQIQDIQAESQQKDVVIKQKETEIQRIQNELQHLQVTLKVTVSSVCMYGHKYS